MRRISKDITKHYQMACSSAELHAILLFMGPCFKICREIPEAEAMAEDTFIDDRNNFRWKDVLSRGLIILIIGSKCR